ncbi:aldolase/citrate lyase family protein [Streptosporangium sp. NPDC002544]|uniref:aldolase/citrate lyase family protein n=1 Tax=Streptosporangium sp. NPDC002544 TaxID=3154538 RepID=UPI0033332898
MGRLVYHRIAVRGGAARLGGVGTSSSWTPSTASSDTRHYSPASWPARTNIAPIVRVPQNERGLIGKVLDAGAHGVIVPMVESADDAQAAVAAGRIPPAGRRSFGPIRASQFLGRDPAALVRVSRCRCGSGGVAAGRRSAGPGPGRGR